MRYKTTKRGGFVYFTNKALTDINYTPRPAVSAGRVSWLIESMLLKLFWTYIL